MVTRKQNKTKEGTNKMKMKKRILTIGIGIAMLASLLFSGMVLADSPTTVDVDWDGAGWVDGSVDTGDALTYFHSEGSNHIGEFHATDNNDNPYSYGVDSCSFSLETAITGGGQAWLEVNRTDSCGSYGPAGQQSYTFVGVEDGDATLQNRSGTNYASLKDCNWGWNANNHVTVTGADFYTIQRWMDSGDVDFAGLVVNGTGDANLDCMNAESSGNWQATKLGSGCGCYTNADFTATGSGTFDLYAIGDTSTTTAMAPGMTGASSFNFIANWVNSTFTVPDYSTAAQ